MIPAGSRKAVRYTLLENINVNRPNGNKDRSLFVPFIKKTNRKLESVLGSKIACMTVHFYDKD